MNRKQYEVGSLPEEIVIGRQTETGVMAIRIDCTGWLTFWPGLALSIWATPPGGSAAYPAKTHMEGNVLIWDVNNSDTAVSGVGTMEIVGIASGKKKLSAIAKTRVERTTTIGTTTPPEAAKAWVDDVMQAAGDAKASKNQAASYAKSAEESAKKAEESAASASVSWENLTGKPSTFPPETHGHAMSEVEGLSDELSQLKDDKLDKTATAADSAKLGGKSLAEIMLAHYPVGAVYISANSTSPASLFGGTWEQINGRFLIGTGTPENNDDGTSPGDYNMTLGSKGGEEKHALTINENASHSHAVGLNEYSGGALVPAYHLALKYDTFESIATDTHRYTAYTLGSGGNQPHNNMPPYLAVYMWKRVS